MGGEDGYDAKLSIHERIETVKRKWEEKRKFRGLVLETDGDNDGKNVSEELEDCTGVNELNQLEKTGFLKKGVELKYFKNVFNTARKWSFGDLFFGMNYYFTNNEAVRKFHHELVQSYKDEGRTDISEFSFSGGETVDDFLYYSSLIHSVFKEINKDNVNKFILENQESILYYDLFCKGSRTGFLLFVDDKREEIILALRGTKSYSDILLDVDWKICEIATGSKFFCHEGCYRSARWFFDNKFLVDLIKSTLSFHEGNGKKFKFTIVGHSLGGSVASVLTFLFNSQFVFPGNEIKCFTFGSFAVFGENLLEKCNKNMICWIADDDIVPFVSEHSVMNLRRKIAEFSWRPKLELDLDLKRGTKLFRFAANVYQKLTKKGKNEQDAPEKKEEVEEKELPMPLYPPGRSIGIRLVDGVVYMKELERGCFTEIPYFSNYKGIKKVHSCKNYRDLFKSLVMIKNTKSSIIV